MEYIISGRRFAAILLLALLFAASRGARGQSLLLTSSDGSTLFTTNGTTVTKLADGSSSPAFRTEPIYSATPSSAVVGSVLYFVMADSTAATSAVWAYDGTALHQITSASDYVYNQADTNNAAAPSAIGSYGSKLAFGQATLASNSAGDGNFDTTTLAIYDPGTQAIVTPAAPNHGYNPHDFVTLGGVLYFEALDTVTGKQAIYSYNGTAVTEVYNLAPTFTFTVGFTETVDAAGAVTGPLVVFNGNLYFGSGQQSVQELTATGSLSNSAVNASGGDGYQFGSSPGLNLVVANNDLFFLSQNNGIFSIDSGNGSTLVLTSLGAQGFVPAAYNGGVYFAADDTSEVQNLYSSTGGAATKISSSFGGSDFIVFGSTLYYNNNGTGLGTITGTTIGTLAVPGAAGGQPLTVVPFTPSVWGLGAIVSPPVVTAGASASFNGGGSAVALDSGLTVTDSSSATLVSATLEVGSFLSGDTLNFTNQNGITGSYNAATGVLTLSGTATVASYQAALDSITYSFSPSNGDPTGGGTHTSRSISWVVNDGTTGSSSVTSSLTVSHVAPTVAAGGTVTFTGGGAAVVLDAALTAGDVDSGGNLTGATVSIGSGIVGDTLNFANQNGITGSYNATTRILTLTGTTTVARYQTALESVTYSFSPSNGDPTGGGSHTTRTLSWVVSDGVASSAAGTSSLATAHAAPTAVAGGTATFTGGGAAVTVDSALTASDVDSGGNLTGATVTISTGFLSGDTLNFTTQNGITASYNPTTGVLTLSGTTTVANYQTALESVTYSFSPSGSDPTGGGTATSRTIDWVVNDGVSSSTAATSTVGVHALPVVTAGASATYRAGGTAAVMDATLSLSYPGSSTLSGAVISIAAGFQSGDALGFTDQNGITGSYNAATGVLTLSGTTSLANYQTALESVNFSSSSGDPSAGGTDPARTIDWTVSDSFSTSNQATSSVSLLVPPSIAGTAAGQTVNDNATIQSFAGVTIGDLNSGQTETVTVTLSAAANGSLASSVDGTYNATTGVYTVSGTAAQVTAAIQALVFTPTPHQVAVGDTVTTTFTLNVSDTATETASDAATTVVVTAVTVPSTTTAAAASAAYSPGSQSVTLSAAVTSAGGTVNAGTVTFTIMQGGLTVGVPTVSGTVTAGVATASYTLPGGAATGTYAIHAAYGGGSFFALSSDNTRSLTVSQADQFIFFPFPSGPIAAGAAVSLGATSNSGLPVTLTLVSGNATLAGTALTINDGNPVEVQASQPGNVDYLPASAVTRTIVATVNLPQAITVVRTPDLPVNSAPFALQATDPSGLPVTFTLVSGPATLAGSTVTLTGKPGVVVIQANQSGNGTYAAAPAVTFSFNVVPAAGASFFFGNGFAAEISPDGGSGTIIGYIPGTQEGFVATIAPDGQGNFSVSTIALVGGSSTGQTLTISGHLTGTTFTATIAPLGVSLSAALDPAGGASAGVAGVYQAESLDSASGSLYAIVGPQNDAFVLTATPSLVTGGSGTATGGGSFTVSAPGVAGVTGTINPATGQIGATVALTGGGSVDYQGLAVGTPSDNPLTNLSARGQVGAGQNMLIMGFVIDGTGSKTVLLRAVGPTLADFGLTGVLSSPMLQLFGAGGTLIGANGGWGGTAALSAAFAQVGAFPLPAASADAALLVPLQPGAYTMQVSSAGGATGAALAEAYDASGNPLAQTAALENVSARGQVATDGLLAVGFVVSGNAPKRVLIRGIGPGLAAFGLTGTLADPFLSVYDNTGKLIAENDNWGTPLPVVAAQAEADAATISAVNAEVGAFALALGSKDAVLLVTLAPGPYTVQLSSVGGAAGVALAEVYQVP